MTYTRLWTDIQECPDCGGSGDGRKDKASRCPGCGGSGYRDDYEARKKVLAVPVSPPAPLTVDQAQSKRIAQLEAQIESMEQSRQVQTVCTTLLQMVVSGDLAYYLSGPGQDTLGAWRKLTQDASEGMRHLAAQEREG